MSAKKEIKLSEQQKEICKLLKEWNSIVDDPKKKKQANEIFKKIWAIKNGRIRPF